MNSSFDPDMLAARSESRAVGINRIYNFVYGWMSAALVISAVAAWKMMHVIAENSSILSNGLMFGLIIAEFALVVGMTAAVHKLPLIASIIMFAVYAALNGVTLSVLLLVYAQSTVQLAFFTAAGTFAGMALLGTVIKKDFSFIGRIAMMLLIGLVVATIVNIFVGSNGLNYIISLFGVGIFTALTAYDAQRVTRLANAEASGSIDTQTANRIGLMCALSLYLDFVNLFIYLLRLFGRSRD